MTVSDRYVYVDVNGTEVPAYLALPGGSGPHPGLLVIEEIFGVNDHIQDVCRRFANEGYAAIAVEHFHREAETLTPYSDPPAGREKRTRLKDAEVVSEMRAGVDHLKGLEEVDEGRVGVIGYCMGGRYSYLAATELPDLSACVVYYGGGIVSDDLNENTPVAPVSKTEDIQCPVMGHFAEKDHAIPLDHVEQIRKALAGAGLAALGAHRLFRRRRQLGAVGWLWLPAFLMLPMLTGVA
ncbi:MAG: dienelactone hydrolase family protein, partial [Nitrospinota bacterium]